MNKTTLSKWRSLAILAALLATSFAGMHLQGVSEGQAPSAGISNGAYVNATLSGYTDAGTASHGTITLSSTANMKFKFTSWSEPSFPYVFDSNQVTANFYYPGSGSFTLSDIAFAVPYDSSTGSQQLSSVYLAVTMGGVEMDSSSWSPNFAVTTNNPNAEWAYFNPTVTPSSSFYPAGGYTVQLQLVVTAPSSSFAAPTNSWTTTFVTGSNTVKEYYSSPGVLSNPSYDTVSNALPGWTYTGQSATASWSNPSGTAAFDFTYSAAQSGTSSTVSGYYTSSPPSSATFTQSGAPSVSSYSISWWTNDTVESSTATVSNTTGTTQNITELTGSNWWNSTISASISKSSALLNGQTVDGKAWNTVLSSVTVDRILSAGYGTSPGVDVILISGSGTDTISNPSQYSSASFSPGTTENSAFTLSYNIGEFINYSPEKFTPNAALSSGSTAILTFTTAEQITGEHENILINWGDSSSTPLSDVAYGAQSQTHTYSSLGTFTITVKVTNLPNGNPISGSQLSLTESTSYTLSVSPSFSPSPNTELQVGQDMNLTFTESNIQISQVTAALAIGSGSFSSVTVTQNGGTYTVSSGSAGETGLTVKWTLSGGSVSTTYEVSYSSQLVPTEYSHSVSALFSNNATHSYSISLSGVPQEGQIPIVITNSQTNATGVYQQLINFPTAQYSNSINSNFSDVYFTFANQTTIPAWIQANASNTFQTTPIWLKLPSIPGGGGSLTVYAHIVPNSVFFGQKWANIGEGNTVNDNGASVFSYYNENVTWYPTQGAISPFGGVTVSPQQGIIGGYGTFNLVNLSNSGNSFALGIGWNSLNILRGQTSNPAGVYEDAYQGIGIYTNSTFAGSNYANTPIDFYLQQNKTNNAQYGSFYSNNVLLQLYKEVNNASGESITFYTQNASSSSYIHLNYVFFTNSTLSGMPSAVFSTTMQSSNDTQQYYQQEIQISNPQSYGLNSGNSNFQITTSSGTPLYTWIQSGNQSSLTFWTKTPYSLTGSDTLQMEVVPSFENLLSANGYLGENGYLSSVYNANNNIQDLGFAYFQDFAGTTLPSDWNTNNATTTTVNNGLKVYGETSGFTNIGSNVVVNASMQTTYFTGYASSSSVTFGDQTFYLYYPDIGISMDTNGQYATYNNNGGLTGVDFSGGKAGSLNNFYIYRNQTGSLGGIVGGSGSYNPNNFPSTKYTFNIGMQIDLSTNYLYLQSIFVANGTYGSMPTASISGSGSTYIANTSQINHPIYTSYAAYGQNLSEGLYTYSIPDYYNSAYASIFYNSSWIFVQASPQAWSIQSTPQGDSILFRNITNVGSIQVTFLEPIQIEYPLGTVTVNYRSSTPIGNTLGLYIPYDQLDTYINDTATGTRTLEAQNSFQVVLGHTYRITAYDAFNQQVYNTTVTPSQGTTQVIGTIDFSSIVFTNLNSTNYVNVQIEANGYTLSLPSDNPGATTLPYYMPSGTYTITYSYYNRTSQAFIKSNSAKENITGVESQTFNGETLYALSNQVQTTQDNLSSLVTNFQFDVFDSNGSLKNVILNFQSNFNVTNGTVNKLENIFTTNSSFRNSTVYSYIEDVLVNTSLLKSLVTDSNISLQARFNFTKDLIGTNSVNINQSLVFSKNQVQQQQLIYKLQLAMNDYVQSQGTGIITKSDGTTTGAYQNIMDPYQYDSATSYANLTTSNNTIWFGNPINSTWSNPLVTDSPNIMLNFQSPYAGYLNVSYYNTTTGLTLAKYTNGSLPSTLQYDIQLNKQYLEDGYIVRIQLNSTSMVQTALQSEVQWEGQIVFTWTKNAADYSYKATVPGAESQYGTVNVNTLTGSFLNSTAVLQSVSVAFPASLSVNLPSISVEDLSTQVILTPGSNYFGTASGVSFTWDKIPDRSFLIKFNTQTNVSVGEYITIQLGSPTSSTVNGVSGWYATGVTVNNRSAGTFNLVLVTSGTGTVIFAQIVINGNQDVLAQAVSESGNKIIATGIPVSAGETISIQVYYTLQPQVKQIPLLFEPVNKQLPFLTPYFLIFLMLMAFLVVILRWDYISKSMSGKKGQRTARDARVITGLFGIWMFVFLIWLMGYLIYLNTGGL